MPTPKKLARQREARQRQQAQMENLAKGATEQAAAQQAAAQSGQPNSRGTANDPKGQVLSTGGKDFQIRVLSAGAEPVNPTTRGSGGGVVRKVSGDSRRSNSAMEMTVSTGAQSRGAAGGGTVRKISDPGVAQQAYGAATVAPQQAQPQPSAAQVPLQNQQPLQNFEAAPPPVPQAQGARADVTVYLTCFERPNYFRRQLLALRNQTIQPSNVVVIVNRGEVNQDEQALSGAAVSIIRANSNLGPWFRFTAALEAPSKYVCVLDDDTLPGPRWLEMAIARLEAAEQEPEIGTLCIAVAGEVFRSDNPADRYEVGPHSPRAEELEVDIGRQGWVFRKELLLPFFNTPRQGTGQIGWAHHLAATLQLEEVLTVVLPYAPNNKEAWGMLESASTERSVSQAVERTAGQGGPNLTFLREQLYKGYRKLGWAPLSVLDAQAAGEESGESA